VAFVPVGSVIRPLEREKSVYRGDRFGIARKPTTVRSWALDSENAIHTGYR
jgi:hypothetical protein